jgi:serine/threonine protein kinase
MYDVALGLTYLHTRRPSIIHRDLKSFNILLSKDPVHKRCKITDFGLARIRPHQTMMHSLVGTPNWQAPEMFLNDSPVYTEKVDIYSLGLIFWEILNWSEKYPFYGLKEVDIFQQVRSGYRPSLTELRYDGYPEDIIRLIEIMWETDPTLRPTSMEIVQFLQQFMD